MGQARSGHWAGGDDDDEVVCSRSSLPGWQGGRGDRGRLLCQAETGATMEVAERTKESVLNATQEGKIRVQGVGTG